MEVPIQGFNGDTLKLFGVALVDSGAYACVLTNACGSDTTEAGLITISPTTEIISQPSAITICEGDSTGFSLSANGENLSYQWYKDGMQISGGNSPTLSFASADLSDAGLYYCEVDGLCGMAASVTVDLIVETASNDYESACGSGGYGGRYGCFFSWGDGE